MKKVFVFLTLLVLIIGCTACALAPKETLEEYRARIKEEYINESARAEKGGIVFLGDSITDGYDTNKYYRDYKVYNRGITSDTSADLLDRLQSTCLIMQPKIIVLLIGINNLGVNTDLLYNDTERILQEIFKANSDTQVIVQSLYPLNKTTSDKFTGYQGTIDNAMVDEYNKRLLTLCNRYCCYYVDMNKELADAKGDFDIKYTSDGLHPNKEGYKVITNKLKPLINSLAKECGIIK